MMTATEKLRRMLDERGVEWLASGTDTCWKSADGYPMRAWDTTNGTHMRVADLTPEQAIAATIGSPVYTFSLDEIEDLYKDLCDSNGGTLMAIVDGVRYETDWGYGVDGVRHFIDMLRRRHRIEVDA